MGKKVRSAKGEQVDFDILKIKEQIASAPPPDEVRQRRDFVDKRLRRRLKTVKKPVAAPVKEPVDMKMPGTEDLDGETKMIDEVEDQPKAKSRQKARPTKKIEE